MQSIHPTHQGTIFGLDDEGNPDITLNPGEVELMQLTQISVICVPNPTKREFFKDEIVDGSFIDPFLWASFYALRQDGKISEGRRRMGTEINPEAMSSSIRNPFPEQSLVIVSLGCITRWWHLDLSQEQNQISGGDPKIHIQLGEHDDPIAFQMRLVKTSDIEEESGHSEKVGLKAENEIVVSQYYFDALFVNMEI